MEFHQLPVNQHRVNHAFVPFDGEFKTIFRVSFPTGGGDGTVLGFRTIVALGFTLTQICISFFFFFLIPKHRTIPSPIVCTRKRVNGGQCLACPPTAQTRVGYKFSPRFSEIIRTPCGAGTLRIRYIFLFVIHSYSVH